MPADLSTLMFVALCVAAVAAGFFDAVVGGGGLVMLPLLLISFPSYATATLFGTNKTIAIWGTAASAVNYARRIEPSWHFVGPMAAGGFVGSFLGAKCVTLVPTTAFKPVVLIAITGVWIFTWRRKSFGELDAHHPTGRRARQLAILGGFGIGFYDGLIGPGTGAFLIILLIVGVGASFLRASATAKIVNTATNLGALVLFAATGHVLWKLGLLLATFNVAGSIVGSKLAIKKGSKFVRAMFLIIVPALILRLAIDLF